MSSNLARALLKRIGVRSISALVILGACAFFYHHSHQREVAPLSSDAQTWKAIIELKGAAEAYKEFGTDFSSFNPGSRHSYAHSFGAALYVTEGPSGFPVCRDLFEYGCAHGFMVRALQMEGEGAVGRLADACRKQPYVSMCMHGIGHGLVSYVGYDLPSFEHSVSICRDIVHDTTTSGCMGGATMEYGLKTMSFGLLSVAPVTEATKYEPCAKTGRDAKPACYFWLTGWWYSSLVTNEKLSPKDAVAKIGKFCELLPEQEYSGECFGGIGDNVAMAADYDAKKAIEFCEGAAKDPSERIYCKAYAENILLGDTRTTENAPYLCNSEKGADRDRCDYLARVGVSIFDTKK